MSAQHSTESVRARRAFPAGLLVWAAALAIGLFGGHLAAGALIAHYQFEESNAGTTPDTVTGGTNYATLGPGVAIDTTGGHDDSGCLNMTAYTPSLPAGADGAVTSNTFTWTSQARTITFWWKDSGADTAAGTYVSMGTNWDTGARFDIKETTGTDFRVEVQGNGQDTSVNLDDGNWHFMAVTVPDGAQFQDIGMYVNGNPTDLNTSTSTMAIATGSSHMVMGDSVYVDGLAYNDDRTPNGYLDEVRVYDEVLTQAQISNLYNYNYTDPPDPATISLGSAVDDTVIQGGTGTLGLTVDNSAVSGAADLDYTVTPAALTGTTYGSVTPTEALLGPDDTPVAHTVDAITTGSTPIGANVVAMTVTDAAATNSPQNINTTLTVLDHANASFAATNLDEVTVDLGTWAADQGVKNQGFSIWNLVTTAGFTARLDLDSGLTGSGSAALSTDLSTFSNLAAGSDNGFTASFDTAGLSIGTYTRDYTLSLSDEDLPGATSQTLTLHLTGEIVAGGNDSTLFFGATPSPLNDTTSATGTTVDFGKVLQFSILGGLVTLNKIGDDDAGYTLTEGGDAQTSTADGTITGNPGSLSIDVSIATGTSGLKSGTITVHNTSADSLGAGQGSADGDDVITVLADVYQYAQASSNDYLTLGDGGLATVTEAAALAGGQRISIFLDDDAGNLAVTGDGWSVDGLVPGVTETGVATTTATSFSGTVRFATGKLNGLYTGTLSMRVEMDQALLGAATLGYYQDYDWDLSETVSGVTGDQSSVFEPGTDLGDLSIARHGISDAGGGTVATLLDGTLSTGGELTIGSWRAGTEGEFGGTFLSDVFSLTGIGSDVIVIQATYNQALLTGSEAALAAAGEIYLGWFDGLEWVNAIAGNTGGTPNFVLGAYIPASHFSLGTYGVDTAANTVWAVINHNSDFGALGGSIIPEPATLSLLVIGALGMIARRRRRCE